MDATQTRKYKKYRISKQKFPTKIINNGLKGVLRIGYDGAKKKLEVQLGRSVDNMKPMHTRTEWVWGELISQ